MAQYAAVVLPLLDVLADRYRVKAEIGQGGMATVYIADDVKHRRQVAVKVLKPEISAAIGRDRFLREIEIAARLNHPHIVPLFDSGAAGDLLYYVMPYVAGESLRTRLRREPQLPLDDALRLAREIAGALAHAHQQDAERYLELAGALAWFWHARSHLVEGRDHLTAALAGAANTPPRRSLARALWAGAYLHALRGETATSRPMMEAGLRMWREIGVYDEVSGALEGLGWTQFLSGDDEQACANFEESLRLQQAGGDPHLINRAKVALAQVLVALGRIDEARRMAAEIIEFSKQHGNLRGEHSGWHYTADCALLEGLCIESLPMYRTSLRLARETGDRIEIGFEIQGVAMSLAGLGASERALWLGGAVEAEYERIGSTLHVRFWNELLAKYFGLARSALGGDRAARAWGQGRMAAFDDAVANALSAKDTGEERLEGPS